MGSCCTTLLKAVSPQSSFLVPSCWDWTGTLLLRPQTPVPHTSAQPGHPCCCPNPSPLPFLQAACSPQPEPPPRGEAPGCVCGARGSRQWCWPWPAVLPVPGAGAGRWSLPGSHSGPDGQEQRPRTSRAREVGAGRESCVACHTHRGAHGGVHLRAHPAGLHVLAA